MISWIIPYYRKLEWFTAVYPRNRCLHSAETVLVLDEPTDEREVVAFARGKRIRVVVNDQTHQWRPPCSPFNVGVRHATGEHVALISPETYVLIEPGYLEQKILALPKRFVLTGRMWHGVGIEPYNSVEMVERYTREHEYVSEIYGMQCCPRDLFIEAGGFDERRRFYGGDDDDLYARLCAKGKRIVDPCIRVVHPYHSSGCRGDHAREPYVKTLAFGGQEFSRVAYDYANVAQMAEQVPSKHQVAGSLPVVRSTL